MNDGFGRRIKGARDGWSAQSLWDGGSLFMSLSGSGGTLEATYSNLPGLDAPLAETRGSSTYYYATDDLGSVEGLFNGSGVQNQDRYDPWGEPQVATGSVSNPLRYAGLPWNGSTGLSYMRARYYDPGLGRFISEDPLGLSAGINPYAYVGNSPTNGTDPSGLDSCTSGRDGCPIHYLTSLQVQVETPSVYAMFLMALSTMYHNIEFGHVTHLSDLAGPSGVALAGAVTMTNGRDRYRSWHCFAAKANLGVTATLDGIEFLSLGYGATEEYMGARAVGTSGGRAALESLFDLGKSYIEDFASGSGAAAVVNTAVYSAATGKADTVLGLLEDWIPVVATRRAALEKSNACSPSN